MRPCSPRERVCLSYYLSLSRSLSISSKFRESQPLLFCGDRRHIARSFRSRQKRNKTGPSFANNGRTRKRTYHGASVHLPPAISQKMAGNKNGVSTGEASTDGATKATTTKYRQAVRRTCVSHGAQKKTGRHTVCLSVSRPIGALHLYRACIPSFHLKGSLQLVDRVQQVRIRPAEGFPLLRLHRVHPGPLRQQTCGKILPFPGTTDGR